MRSPLPANLSIRTQLVLLVLAVTVPVAALGAYALQAEMGLRKRMAEEAALDVAEITAGAVSQFVTETSRTLEGLAGRPAVRSMDRARCEGFLFEAHSVLGQYANLFLTREDGTLVCTVLPPPEGPVPSGAGTDWHGRVRRDGRFAIGKPQMGRLSNRWVSVFAHAVTDSAGATVGYIGASVDLRQFQALLTRPQLPRDAVITLAHIDRTVVARSADAEAWVGRLLTTVEGGDQHATLGRGVTRAKGVEGVDRVWGYSRVGGTEWMVYAGFPTEWVYSGLGTRTAVAVGAGGLVLLLLGLFATGIYRNVTGALHELTEGVRLRELGQVAPRPSGPPEIAAVGWAFEKALEDRIAAEEALRRSTERYESIFEHAVFGIYISTVDGRLLEANPAMARILGYESPAELLDIPVGDHYAVPAERDRLIGEALAGEDSGRVDVEWIRRDGTPLQVRLYWSTIQGSEGDIAFEVLAEDLTDRRVLEEQFRQAQKLEAVGRLAGGVAHDFNNRLMVIRGQAEMLLADLPEDSPLRLNAGAIAESADRAAALTAQLLAFSRRQVARPRYLDVSEVVGNLAKVLPRVMGGDIEIVTDLAPDLDTIYADPGQVDQILLNLCTNARDAMPDGGHLVLGTRVAPVGAGGQHVPGIDPGRYVVLTVRDTGHGMDEDIRDHVFEPFFTTKPEGKGTGLGLSTVYGLVAQSGGTIRVHTGPDEGTIFEVYLPVANGPATRELDEPDRLPPAPDSHVTVLVAEDEEAVRNVLVRCLTRVGYTVLEAVDGPSALDVARRYDGPIDLLLTDIVMPGMKGPELADRLADERSDLPVLFVSGYTDGAPVQDDREDSPRDFLAKPFTPLELLRAVRSLLERARRVSA